MSDPLRSIRQFAAELKRRKVYRVGVAYVVIAVGALQLLDVLLPATRLPTWSDELFLGLVVLGLPLVLVLAWMFDMTPTGMERTGGPQPDSGARNAEGHEGERSHASPSQEPETLQELDTLVLAVLPFENLSGTEEAAPFAAGLHDDLLTEMSRIGGLTVISRTSVMGYRGTTLPIPKIALELGAGSIVEGGVRQVGDRVRLNVQLVDARTDGHLWAERYDRRLTTESIFDIQAELAEKIAATLHAEFSPTPPASRGPDPTDSLEAYRLCARGRTRLEQRTRVALREAHGLFQSALKADPEYGRAWAGVASSLALMTYYDFPRPDGPSDPLDAARRAVELAPADGDAHTAMGIVWATKHEGPRALQAFRQAMKVAPGDAEAHEWAGWLLVVLGRAAEAREFSIRGAELSPRSPPARAFLGITHLAGGEMDQAFAEAQRAGQLQPDFLLARFLEAVALYHLDRCEEARTLLADLLPAVGPDGIPSRAEVRAVMALIHLRDGDSGAADELLQQIRVDGNGFPEGLVLAARGEHETAWAALERVGRWDSLGVEQVRYLYPDVLGPLRAQPRWSALMRNVDLSWGVDA